MESRRDGAVTATLRSLQRGIRKREWAVQRREGGGVTVSTRAGGRAPVEAQRWDTAQALEEVLDQKEGGVGWKDGQGRSGKP